MRCRVTATNRRPLSPLSLIAGGAGAPQSARAGHRSPAARAARRTVDGLTAGRRCRPPSKAAWAMPMSLPPPRLSHCLITQFPKTLSPFIARAHARTQPRNSALRPIEGARPRGDIPLRRMAIASGNGIMSILVVDLEFENLCRQSAVRRMHCKSIGKFAWHSIGA